MRVDLNINARRKLANTLANQAGLNLIEEENGVARTDGKNIYVGKYSPAWNWGSKQANHWWYTFLHEIMHNIYYEDFDVIKKNKVNMQTTFGMIHNINVDYNIENKGKGLYPGLLPVLLSGVADLINDRFLSVKNITKKLGLIDAMLTFDIICRKDWNNNITTEDQWIDSLDKEGKEALDKLMLFKDEYQVEKTAEECYELTRKICDSLGIKEETEQKQQEEGNSGSEEGDENEESDEKGEEAAEGLVDYMELLTHTHDEDGTEETKTGGPVKIDYSKWKSYLGYTSTGFEYVEASNKSINTSVHKSITAIKTGENLAKEIRKHLLVMTQSHHESGFKKGRLDGSKLWKPKVYGAYSQSGSRVYKKKVQRNKLDTAVLVLVDQSGSMASRNKYAHAAKAASILTDLLNSLRIPLEIQGFTDNDYSQKVVNIIHKRFAEHKTSSDIEETFARSYELMSANADGESIINAFSDISCRKEQRKIMVVLSDGQPSTCVGSGDIFGYTKKVVHEIETLSPVDIYGIGIMSDSVKQIYKDNVVINNAGDIETALLTLLKDHVLV